MKKIIFAVLLAVIFCLSSCGYGTTGGEKSPFEGIWGHIREPTSNYSRYTFSGDKLEWIVNYKSKLIGTFKYDDTTIYFTVTRIWEDIATNEFKEGNETMSMKYLFEENGNLVFPNPTNPNDHGNQYVKIN